MQTSVELLKATLQLTGFATAASVRSNSTVTIGDVSDVSVYAEIATQNAHAISLHSNKRLLTSSVSVTVIITAMSTTFSGSGSQASNLADILSSSSFRSVFSTILSANIGIATQVTGSSAVGITPTTASTPTPTALSNDNPSDSPSAPINLGLVIGVVVGGVVLSSIVAVVVYLRDAAAASASKATEPAHPPTFRVSEEGLGANTNTRHEHEK